MEECLKKGKSLLFSSTYCLEGPQLCFSHACTCLWESSLPPGGSTSKKWFTSNAAKVEHLKSGGSCTSNEEQVWGKCKRLRMTQEGFLTALDWRFSQDLQDAKLILRFLASPPFMSLPEHSCVNLSSGCLFASYKLPPLGSLGTSACPEAGELLAHFHISMLKTSLWGRNARSPFWVRQRSWSFPGQVRFHSAASPLSQKNFFPLEMRKWTTLTINYLATTK